MSDNYNKQLGARLRAIRKSRELSQQDVANVSNGKLTKHKISHYERGDTMIPAQVIPTLCKIYGLTPSQLLGWKEESYDRESEIIEDIRRINDFTNEIAMKYEEDGLLVAASGAEDFDDKQMELLMEDVEMVKRLGEDEQV